METKQCSKCKITKVLSDFYNHNTTKDGKTHHCKACMTTYRKKNVEKQRLYMQNLRATDNERVKEMRNKSYRKTDPAIKVVAQARGRAKRKNIEFNLEVSKIYVPTVCPYLKVPFIIGKKGNYEYTYSIDRIDNSKGYIQGNVELITKKANLMKNSATKKELINFAIEVILRNKDNDIVRTMLKNIELEDKELLS
jgi:hypothetical protein